MLLNMRARSPRDLSLRRARCHERISRTIALIASLLTAGRKLTKCLPHLFLASRGRNVLPQERERRDLMIATPVVVLAVDDARLVRMQLQTDRRQPLREGVPHLPGPLLTDA